MTEPLITFLSDYGLEDEFVGVCHGVIASICPQAHVIDLTHGVPRHDVRAGALILRASLGYLPKGVHLAVVDPGVGGDRRAVALQVADGRTLVGPDNGLLMPAASLAGGIVEAFDIGRSRFRLEPVSATFHGRDVFAPVAAHLAGDGQLREAGEPINPAGLVRLELPQPGVDDGVLVAHVLYVDRFGNVQLDAGSDDLRAARLEPGNTVEIELGSGRALRALLGVTFGDVDRGETVLCVGSQGWLELAINQGDAGGHLGLGVDDTLRIKPA
ncbi:MAG: SAM-dependent chlorinase/fluorinase [Actinomycetota bacterium]|nr:SAM-dependent chlorinase/fluorinase [Actinomycetota bacterium]